MEEVGSSGAVKQRLQYTEYSAKERAQIGKYAAENGPTKASRHFPKILGKSACAHEYVWMQIMCASHQYKNCQLLFFIHITKYNSSPLRFILYGNNYDNTCNVQVIQCVYCISGFESLKSGQRPMLNGSRGMYELSKGIKFSIRSVLTIKHKNMYYNREIRPCHMLAEGESYGCTRKVIVKVQYSVNVKIITFSSDAKLYNFVV